MKKISKEGQASDGELMLYEAGEIIFSAGDSSEGLYAVKQGSVEIFHTVKKKGGKTEEVVLEEVGECDMFGEMGLVECLPRSASARAVGETLLLYVSRENLVKYLSALPPWVYSVIKHSFRRLRQANQKLYDAMEKSGEGDQLKEDAEIVEAHSGLLPDSKEEQSGEEILKALGDK